MNKEERRIYNKKYNEGHKEEHREYMKRYQQERDKEAREAREVRRQQQIEMNPLRQQKVAYHAVEIALRAGELIKPKVCSKCGSTGRIEGHHEDYDKPLEVEWLCSSCHRKRSREKKSKNDQEVLQWSRSILASARLLTKMGH